MSEPSDPEELLAALLAGDRHEHDAEVQAAFVRWPWLRERLRRLRSVADRLDNQGSADRATLAASLRTPSPHESAALATVHRQLRRPVPLRRWLTLAAVALVALAGAFWALRPPAANERSMLDLTLGELRPAGEVSDYTVFRWHLVTPPQGSYVVRFRAGDDSSTELLATRVTVPEWRPSTDDLTRLRPRMRWEVEVYDAQGQVTAVAGPVSVWQR